MRYYRWLFFYLLVVFTGSLAQKRSVNNRGDENDDEDPSQGDNNGKFLPNNRVQTPSPAGTNDARTRATPTQLASDENCQADVQKYCGKGSSQLLSNLKVLQCIDDLDNVSRFFSTGIEISLFFSSI